MVKTSHQTPIWNYLLLGAFALTAGAAVLLIAGAFIVPRVIDRTIERYTDPAPVAGAAVEVSDRDYASLKDRVDAFADAVDASRPHEPLVLSSDEFAALVQRELQAELDRPDSPVEGIWLRVAGDKLKGPVSVRMDRFASGWFQELHGRYLNGVATLDVRLAGNRFDVHLDEFAIDGTPLPGWMLDGLQEAIDRAVADSRELRDVAEKLGAVEIIENQVIIRTKRPAR